LRDTCNPENLFHLGGGRGRTAVGGSAIMFTGIIQEIGKVRKVKAGSLLIESRLSRVERGESISVNGVCLTVARLHLPYILEFNMSEETVKRTNLGRLKLQSRVNMERSLKAEDRLGGHLVTGHVEGTGRIKRIRRQKNSLVMEIDFPLKLKKYMVPKGSIAVDGISLTLTDVRQDTFMVTLVPHTLENTTIGLKKVGDHVNLETDILAKYAEHYAGKAGGVVTLEKLKKAGFIH